MKVIQTFFRYTHMTRHFSEWCGCVLAFYQDGIILYTYSCILLFSLTTVYNSLKSLDIALFHSFRVALYYLMVYRNITSQFHIYEQSFCI